VAFHEEMPKIPLKVHVEQHPPSLPWSRKSRQTKWINTLVVEKINLQKNQKEKLSFPDGSQSNPEGTM
jgi:hypothetical protein